MTTSETLKDLFAEISATLTVASDAVNKQRADRCAALTDALRALEQEPKLLAEIAEAREACPVVRMQDYFDAPLLTLINEEISQLFRMQSRAEQAEADVVRLRAELDEWRLNGAFLAVHGIQVPKP